MTILIFICFLVAYVCLTAAAIYAIKGYRTAVNQASAADEMYNMAFKDTIECAKRLANVRLAGMDDESVRLYVYDEEAEQCVELTAYFSEADEDVVIKRFRYDEDDEASRAYAQRCAEELKDKMEEKQD